MDRPRTAGLAIRAAVTGALIWAGLMIGFNAIGNWWDKIEPLTSGVGP